MENYFILLELPFDPPENDAGKIAEAIAAKQTQWSRDMVNPVKKAKVSEYIAHISEIKNVMLDPEAREKEAAEARQIKGSKKKELVDSLALYHTKGDSLSAQDLKLLVRTFGAFGFTEAEIRGAFEEGNRKQKDGFQAEEVLDKAQAHNIRNYMRQLDRKGESLYDFLGLAPDASCRELCQAADAVNRKILQKGKKSGQDGAVQSLCGLCGVIFRTEEGKQKYDNYVTLTRFDALNDAIDEMAMGNQRCLEPRMKEGLIDRAVGQYRISVSESSAYINDYCAYMGYVLSENKLICGLCGTENPMGAQSCVKCGKPLLVTCPSCGTRNNNSARNCVKCGFDLSQMERAVALLQQARQLHAAKSYDEAQGLLKEALVFWPGHPDVRKLEEAIAAERRQASDAVAAIMADLREKRLYAARTKIAQARTGGFGVDEALAAQVDESLARIEERLALLRTKEGDEAFRIVLELSEQVTDCEELKQNLAKYPPSECPAVSCAQAGKDVTLTWLASESLGEVAYRLVRKENSAPNDPEDGEALYTGRELGYTDSGLRHNRLYYYAVYAVRLGVFSRAARPPEPVAAVECVSGGKAVGGDGSVSLSWVKPQGATEIRVARYCGSERPKEEGAYEPVPCTRPDGILLEGLENGACYWFSVCAGVVLNGRTYYSEPVHLSAVPQKPAMPLQEFALQQKEGAFRCSWRQSEWDVVLLYADRKPEYTVGVVYDMEELLQKYKKVDFQMKGRTEGEFRLEFVGECYLIPAVIRDSNVVLSEAVYLSSVPCARDVSFEVNASGTEMYVSFAWPQGVERCLVVYRMDTWPGALDDPYAHQAECSRKQYEANQGVLIRNPEAGTYYAQVYVYLEKDGRRICSEGVKARFDNRPQMDVFYSFEYKKPGLFHKKTALLFTVEISGCCVLPPFVIVGKYKGIPLKRSDGEAICIVAQATEIQENLTFEFDVPVIRAGMRLKMFFLDDQNYKNFKLACKAGNTI